MGSSTYTVGRQNFHVRAVGFMLLVVACRQTVIQVAPPTRPDSLAAEVCKRNAVDVGAWIDGIGF